jgi:hypothetical protein
MVSPSIHSPFNDGRISTGRDSPTLPLCNKDAKVQAKESTNMIRNGQLHISLFDNKLQLMKLEVFCGLQKILKRRKEIADMARSYLPS